MAYRSDFYIAKNITGYTGPIISNPTVYFRCGNESGHITQLHEVEANEGREEVIKDDKYVIENRADPVQSGKVVCYESWPSRAMEHWSRSKLETDIKEHHRELLAQAVQKCTELKRWCKLTDNEKKAEFNKKPKSAERMSVTKLIKIHEGFVVRAAK
ncbi:MAG: hypothetical protein JXR49_19855 [Acidobacteria bacterium]|nr:hypothetical protein [Acidobacteriota bacterium]